MRDRWHFLISGFLGLYVIGEVLPAESLWFNPSPPVFGNAVAGESPHLDFYARTIHSAADIRFAAVVREVGEAPWVCAGEDGPFKYQPAQGPVLGKDLGWWTAYDVGCEDLPPGTYWVQTTWTVERPLAALLPDWLHLDSLLGGILSAKDTTRDSPAFTITPIPPTERT